MPTPQIKDEKTYRALRREGNRGEVGPDRQRGRRKLAQESRRPRRQEPQLRGLDEEAASGARPRNRRQGPFIDEQAAADLRAPQPLIPAQKPGRPRYGASALFSPGAPWRDRRPAWSRTRPACASPSGSSAATRWRRRPAPPLVAPIALFGALPCAEELWRCWRARPTAKPLDSLPNRRPRRSS